MPPKSAWYNAIMANGRERNEELLIMVEEGDSDEHMKTVYARFGAAIYFAQCLEHEIVNVLVYLDLIPNHAQPVRSEAQWTQSVDDFMDRHFEKTLGQMIARLRTVVAVPDEVSTTLSEALKKRNWLAHDYFRERATECLSSAGRDCMIAELEVASELFQYAAQLLDMAFKPIREKYGFTDERLRQAHEQMLSESR